MSKVTVSYLKGDITELFADAIVNPANSYLKLGGGVAGAIARKGGEEIQKECDKIGFCPVGNAVITTGGKLKAKHVIHAVGPRYGVDEPSDKLLYDAVYSALKLSEEKKLSSIALPAISTGIFGYPVKEAAEIITKAIHDFIKTDPKYIQDIILCLFDDETYKIFLSFSEHNHDH